MMVLYFMKMDNKLKDLSKFIRNICTVIVLILVIFGAYIHIGVDQLQVVSPLKTSRILGDIHQKLPRKDPVKTARYTKMKSGPIYILGVAGGNTSDNSSWDIFKLYASVRLRLYNKHGGNFSCCFKYNISERIEQIRQQTTFIRIPYSEDTILAVHFTCYNPKMGIIPNGVALAVDEWPCDERHVTYVPPFLPLKEPGLTLAVSTKAAYGKISAEQIIEWMETYKYLGVDKIVTHYFKDINENALKVLKYYATTGELDLYRHKLAASDHHRIFSNDKLQFCHDKQMTVFDSYERSSGYTYYGILDHDDFLFPSGNRSLKQMLADLYNQNPKAAGFVFKTEPYYLSWGPSGHINDLILGTYVNKTNFGPGMSSNKLIYKTKYVSPGSVHTHHIIPLKGFEMLLAPTDAGLIHHYRPCRTSKLDPDIRKNCLYKFERVRDTSVAEWSQRIRENVEDVRQRVFGSKATVH